MLNMPPSEGSALSNTFSQALKRFGVPGAVFACTEGKRETVLVSGVLSSSTRTPVTRDSYFQIGSITKVYTATLIHQLTANNRLNLDEHVYSYLPEFTRLSGTLHENVKLRHLLNHTSGIDGDAFVDTGRGDDCVALFEKVAAGVGKLHEPGETFSYCNTGYVLAGRIIETITGMYWHDAVRENILSPLGIGTTLVLPEHVMQHPFAIGHVKNSDGRGFRVVDPLLLPRSNEPAGSTPWSDMTGLLSFARYHLTNGCHPVAGRLLPPEAARLMRQRDIDCPECEPFSAWGSGWALFDWNGRHFFGHDGLTRGQAAFLRMDPRSGTILAMFANGGDMRGLFMEMAGRVLGTGPGFAPHARHAPASFDGKIENYAGVYSKFSDALVLSPQSDGLRLQVEPRNDPAGIVRPIQVSLKAMSNTLFVGHLPNVSTPLAVNFSCFDSRSRPKRVHMHLRAYNRTGG